MVIIDHYFFCQTHLITFISVGPHKQNNSDESTDETTDI